MKNIKTVFRNNKDLETYLKINLIFAGIIIAIIIYSGIFSEKNEHPVKCVHFEQTGIKCKTCGISRSFSEIVRFNFNKAKEFNPNGIPVFLFFFVQLVLRIIISFILLKTKIKQNNIMIADIIISVILFIVTFRNLLYISQ